MRVSKYIIFGIGEASSGSVILTASSSLPVLKALATASAAGIATSSDPASAAASFYQLISVSAQ
jgi:hypothetical protein